MMKNNLVHFKNIYTQNNLCAWNVTLLTVKGREKRFLIMSVWIYHNLNRQTNTGNNWNCISMLSFKMSFSKAIKYFIRSYMATVFLNHCMSAKCHHVFSHMLLVSSAYFIAINKTFNPTVNLTVNINWVIKSISLEKWIVKEGDKNCRECSNWVFAFHKFGWGISVWYKNVYSVLIKL